MKKNAFFLNKNIAFDYIIYIYINKYLYNDDENDENDEKIAFY